MSRPVRWLHISDLHLGSAGQELWWTVRRDFEHSVKEWVGKLGVPDLILVSGDLSSTGQRKEFTLFDRFLDDLLKWIGEPAPLVIPVPGNHDLQRPQKRAALQYRVLEKLGQGVIDEDVQLVQEELWTEGDTTFIDPLFKEYSLWLKRRILPTLRERATVHSVRFPGDLFVQVDIDGTFPLVVVGLNSTWQQYRGGDFERKLCIPAQQFLEVLKPRRGAEPFDGLGRGQRAILMMHQPPSWLSEKGRETFADSIYLPRNFDLFLHGHLHEGRSVSERISGGGTRNYFQARSLNGLDEYRKGDQTLRRQKFGYAWGSLSEEGEAWLWPLQWVRRGGGEGAFVHDESFTPHPEGGVLLRPADGTDAHQPLPTPSKKPPTSLKRYLTGLEGATRSLGLKGIFTERSAKGVVQQPIERLYTPLRSRGDFTEAGEDEASARLADGEPGSLARLLPRYERLLIEGQPGAGKSTFLQLVACMLARDRLGKPCPEGPSWSQRYLGLTAKADETPPVPVLVRLAEVVPLLQEQAPGRRDDRERLLDFLETASDGNKDGIDRVGWRRLLEGGEVVLLLDGLDEVADGTLRERLFAVFRDAVENWPGRMVVASRPIQTAELRVLGFHSATIEPFRDREIRTFLDQWVAAVHGLKDISDLDRSAEEDRQSLETAILDHPGVRRLAANPVMLTCLCVVHFNEGGRLPEGRSRVYRAVIKWLLAAREKQRQKEGFTEAFAEIALAQVAFTMMTGATESIGSTDPDGKRSVWDLRDAVKVLDPELERQFPNEGATGRRRLGRRWLRFECLGSGIVEERSEGSLRFWHLTFQEYLAAVHLAWQDEEVWWPIVRDHLDDAQWRETLELFPGCLLLGGRTGVDHLLQRILALREGKTDLETDARVAGALGRLLAPLEVLGYKPPQEVTAGFAAARDAVMPIFEKEGAAKVPVEVRIAAAEALGRGGDPRLRDLEANLLEVPGLDGVRLGRYPVTVEEYRRFVEEERGYEEGRFWSPEGWEMREEKGWQAPDDWQDQLLVPNRPVVGVSWYEADAYCRWLSLTRKCAIHLPSGEEWLAAASPDEREYPWGPADPTPELANFGGNVGRPTPVGIYPEGVGEYGHHDLGGNVWEWGSDEVEVSAEMRKKHWDDTKEPFYALRGGSWDHSAPDLRASYRFGGGAGRRRVRVGFRVAASASP